MRRKAYHHFFQPAAVQNIILSLYIQETTGEVKDLSDISVLLDVLQKNTHIVAQYFDIRTRNYFHDVMSPAFGVTSFWYRQ
jgi:hypothetical protein